MRSGFWHESDGLGSSFLDLELADYDARSGGGESPRGIRQEAPPTEPAPLYRRTLGEAPGAAAAADPVQ
jgi:hypothetical protein